MEYRDCRLDEAVAEVAPIDARVEHKPTKRKAEETLVESEHKRMASDVVLSLN